MKTIRSIFLVLFVLSTLAVLLLFVFPQTSLSPFVPVTQTAEIVSAPSAGDPSTVDPSTQNSSDVNFTALIGSVVASVTSLVGFITSTAITWRKEKREAALAEVERKKLELELERNKLEIKELKKSKVKKK
jgi:ABC-type transport system substrate-binding protein